MVTFSQAQSLFVNFHLLYLSSVWCCWLLLPSCGTVLLALQCSVSLVLLLPVWFLCVCVCMCVVFFARSFSFVYSLILVFLRALLSFFSLHFLPPGVLVHFYVFVKHLYLDNSQYFSPELQTYIFVCWRSSLRCLIGAQTMYVRNWTHQLSPQENLVLCIILFPSCFGKKNYSYLKPGTHRLVLPSFSLIPDSR